MKIQPDLSILAARVNQAGEDAWGKIKPAIAKRPGRILAAALGVGLTAAIAGTFFAKPAADPIADAFKSLHERQLDGWRETVISNLIQEFCDKNMDRCLGAFARLVDQSLYARLSTVQFGIHNQTSPERKAELRADFKVLAQTINSITKSAPPQRLDLEGAMARAHLGQALDFELPPIRRPPNAAP